MSHVATLVLACALPVLMYCFHVSWCTVRLWSTTKALAKHILKHKRILKYGGGAYSGHDAP